ncbi:MAG: DNA polymerase III subunit chi [Pseudomonadota bacterium]
MASITFLDSGDMDRAALSRFMARFVEARVAEGRRVVLRVADARTAARWDQFLWTWDDLSFIPHSILGTTWPADEPVTVTTRLPPPAPDLTLICLDDVPLEDLEGHDDVYELVDRNSEEGVERARERWSAWKTTGRSREYRSDWTTGGSQ